MLQLPNYEKCPCHSGRKYGQCCQPFHEERRKPSPRQLMRARYAAYALEGVPYIMKTTHPDSPHFNPNLPQWERELFSFCHDVSFESLEVGKSLHKRNSEVAFVTFKAGLRDQKGIEVVMTEKSEFRFYDEEWFYYAGLEADL
ncbi:MAG: YchJ family protein [Phototrophicaceae bacterium]